MSEAQERGMAREYRVIAINKAGEGVPSNTVDAVVWCKFKCK